MLRVVDCGLLGHLPIETHVNQREQISSKKLQAQLQKRYGVT